MVTVNQQARGAASTVADNRVKARYRQAHLVWYLVVSPLFEFQLVKSGSVHLLIC
jgi:hypothetical protein